MAKSKGGVSIKGIPELLAQFKRLQSSMQGQVLATAALAGLKPIENEIIANAPYKTGTYRRSIHSAVVRQGRGSVLAATGTNVAYAMRLEFGFVGTDSLGRNYHQGAQPHIRPAYANNRQAALRETLTVLKLVIQAAV